MCNSCEVLFINGVKCHETGCPESWRDYKRSCKWCGRSFVPSEQHQECCDSECNESYYN